MKNLKPSNLKTCIFIEEEIFRDIFASIFEEYNADNNEIDVEIDVTEGIYFCAIDNETVYKKLAEYFDIEEITSIHIDQCEEHIGVWICYKN